MKMLIKLSFGHVETILRSFGAKSIDMKKLYENEPWVEKCLFLPESMLSAQYSINVEITTWKYFFRKVWIMGYIF